jgi:hypothetical protein
MTRESLSLEPSSTEIASIEDVEGAVAALTEEDTYRLEKFAKNRIARIGKKALGRTHRELLDEALGAALAGTRRWKPSAVSFIGFLLGAMRSISSHWAEKFRPIHAPQVQLGQDREDSRSLLDKIADPAPAADGVLECVQLLDKVEALFVADEDAAIVFSSWRQGDAGTDIRDALDWSEQKYNTVARRIYRTARRHLGDEYAQ